MPKSAQRITTPDGVPITIPAKWSGRPGVTAGFEPPPITRLRMFIHGEVEAGKTAFGRSIPRALVFDFENKATAALYAAPGNLAMYLDSAGAYEKVIDELIADAQAGTRPFDYVCWDVVDKWTSLVREHLTKVKSAELGRTLRDIAKWGKEGAGWAEINDFVCLQFDRLYRAGYGLIAFSHVKRVIVQEGKTHRVYTESTVKPVIRTYLYTECEFSGTIEHVQDVSAVKTATGPVKTSSEWKYVLRLDSDTATDSRQHIPLVQDRIVLPVDGGWAAFAKQYKIARIRAKSQLT